MKPFEGFKAEASNNKIRSLPAGPYVAKIKAVKLDGKEPDQQLILRLDVCEGEYTDYFLKRYRHDSENSKYEPKYKGDFRLRIPNEDSPYYVTNLKRFNDAMWRIKKSNEGFTWEWDEQALVGLLVGISMQEDEFNGNKFTRIARLEVADDVRKGIIGVMPPYERKGDAYDTPPAPAPRIDQQSGFTAVETEDLPF